MTLEHKELSRILETAVVAARLAGQRAMEEMDFVKPSIKNGNEMVTAADAICQKIIIDRIKESYPDHGFIAEEGSGGGIFKQSPRSTPKIWWVIDPIDGTNNFAHKMPVFSVSIAAFSEGKLIAGVVFAPATESMFTAVDQGQPQLNGRHITASDEEMSKFTSIALDANYQDTIPEGVSQLMLQTRYRNLGTTALHLSYVGSGGLIATVASGQKLWDIAAGALIAQSAGAIVTDWQGRDIFGLDLENYQAEQFQILAANKKNHPKILEFLRS